MKRCLLILLLCGAVMGQTNTFNPNPLRLDSRGKAQVYLGPGQYRLVLYAPWKQMTGNYCNGSAMGAIEWERDNVQDLGDSNGSPVRPAASEVNKKDGTPAAGYFLCSYKAGTTTPLMTYREPYVKPVPKPKAEDCETYYQKAHLSSRGLGVTVTVLTVTANMVDILGMHAYATMYLACNERSR